MDIEKLKSEAKFLKKWSKGKPVKRASSASQYWSAGKWQTRIEDEYVIGMAAAGLIVLKGNATDAGASFTFNKE